MAYIKPLDQKTMNPETLNVIKALGKKAYPNYRGRKWELRFATSYTMENYWDGGSKTYAFAINLATGEISAPSAATTDPFNKAAHASFEIPAGFGIIENSIFCGKPMGISLVIRPDETKVLGYVPALPVA
jgi:hypothetical protein